MHRDIQSVKHLHVWCGNWHPLVCTRTDFCKMLADDWLVARALSKGRNAPNSDNGSPLWAGDQGRCVGVGRMGGPLLVA
jgi:hypothetical protein